MRIVFVGNHSVSFSSETHHAKSLESLGHEVIRLQEAHADGEQILMEALRSDALIHVHTHGWLTPGLPLPDVFRYLKEAGIPTLTYHLDLWFGLQRQNDLEADPFYKEIGHFFSVDKLMADWFNEHTSVKGHYMRAGVFDEECDMLYPSTLAELSIMPDGLFEVGLERKNDVIFVGSRGYHPEWSYRPQVVDWLAATYGDRFQHWGGDGRGVIRGEQLNQLYADTKVAVGDSLCLGFDYPYYWSDRLYETLGRGGFLIMPYIKGLEEEFLLDINTPKVADAELITYPFGDFEVLRYKIDYYLAHDDERDAIRRRGHDKVVNNYTYKHRWQAILEEVRTN